MKRAPKDYTEDDFRDPRDDITWGRLLRYAIVGAVSMVLITLIIPMVFADEAQWTKERANPQFMALWDDLEAASDLSNLIGQTYTGQAMQADPSLMHPELLACYTDVDCRLLIDARMG